MPTQFKINRYMSDELLTHIQTHPRVVSAIRSNEFITVTLDGNYTVEQIRNQVISHIRTKQQEIHDRGIAERLSHTRQEYEMI